MLASLNTHIPMDLMSVWEPDGIPYFFQNILKHMTDNSCWQECFTEVSVKQMCYLLLLEQNNCLWRASSNSTVIQWSKQKWILLCKHCTFCRNVTQLYRLSKIIMIWVEMHDAVWCYPMVITEVQIQAICLKISSLWAILWKRLCGDNEDRSFFFPVRWNKRSVVLLFTRKRGKQEGNNYVEEEKDIKAMDSTILVKIGWAAGTAYYIMPNEPLAVVRSSQLSHFGKVAESLLNAWSALTHFPFSS